MSPIRHLPPMLAMILIAFLAIPAAARADNAGRYVDRARGFSFSMPRFAPSLDPDASTVAVAISGPTSDGFAPNVNVVVHNLDTTLDAYQQLQRQELSGVGWNVLEQSKTTIHGMPALRTHARGSFRGLEIEYLAITIIKEDKRVYALTCTATTEQFPKFKDEFDRVAASFALGSP